MPNELSDRPATAGAKVRFEWNIMVVAKLAAWYNQGGPHKPPQPGALDSIRPGPCVINSVAYTVTKAIHPVTRELCLVLTEHTGHNAAGGPKKAWRVPVKTLERITVELEAEELAL